jgi:hemolysin D
MSGKQKNRPAESLEFLSDAEAITYRPIPGFARGTLYLLFFLIVFVFLWAGLSEIDRVVTARGKLVTTSSTLLVQPFVTSVVRSLDVREGQVVKKDQLLGTFDPTFAEADLARLQSQARELQARLDRVEAELEGKDLQASVGDSLEYNTHRRVLVERLAHHQARITHFREAINRLLASAEANREDQAILSKRLASAVEIEGMESQMQIEGNSSKLKVLLAKDQRLALENELQTSVNQEKILRHQVTTAEAELTAYERNRRREIIEEMSTVRAELRSVQEQIAKAARLAFLSEMHSPVDAVVLKVAERSIGSVVREAEPLITLVPLDAPLEAKVEIEARDIGYVRPGDLVRIKLDAFPFQKHDVMEGKLRIVSEDAFTQEDGLNRGSMYYEAKAGLGDKKLENLPKDARLIPGMTLTAEVVVGRRTVLSYFLYPVMRMLDESIREP